MANKVWNNFFTLTDKDRFKIVDYILSCQQKNSQWFDDEIVTYIIKMLLENGIVLMSVDVYNIVNSNPATLLFKANAGKKFLSSTNVWKVFSDIRSHTPQTHYYLQDKIKRDAQNFTWDHVVPTKCLIDEIKRLKNIGQWNLTSFRNLVQQYGYVCIITQAENKKLDSAGLRNTMPKGWVFNNPSTHPFNARYLHPKVGITIK